MDKEHFRHGSPLVVGSSGVVFSKVRTQFCEKVRVLSVMDTSGSVSFFKTWELDNHLTGVSRVDFLRYNITSRFVYIHIGL